MTHPSVANRWFWDSNPAGTSGSVVDHNGSVIAKHLKVSAAKEIVRLHNQVVTNLAPVSMASV